MGGDDDLFRRQGAPGGRGGGAMTRPGLLFWLVAAIAALTVATGVMQILWPGVILGILATDQTPAALHFFGLVGMFMALFGGVLLHSLFGGRDGPSVLSWGRVEK